MSEMAPARMKKLEDAAKSAGLVDLDLLKLVTPGASPTDEIAELRRLYPGAFRRADARTMTPAEYGAALREVLGQNAQAAARRVRDHIERDRAKGDVRGLSEPEYQKRRADFVRGLR